MCVMNRTSTANRDLTMTFHGRILDQLGSQTYQSAVASIAELVANAWDADAETVDVQLPDGIGEGAEVVVEDNGVGLDFNECQNRYLNIGYCRRGQKSIARTSEGRIVLGRKGIGKFAGFGIAKIIRVDTISSSTGEKTSFEMNLDKLAGEDYMKGGGTLNAEWLGPDEERKKIHGTKITLKKLFIKRAISKSQFPSSMARRFLLHQTAANFRILVDGKDIPKDGDLAGVEYMFPRDYDEIPSGMKLEEDFGVETLSNGEAIRWKMYFYKDTIREPELQGITVFANDKLAQKPFFFDLAGGLGGQAGQSYMSGQVKANYVDQRPDDYQSAERQRINWDLEDTMPLLNWGQAKVKELLRLWRDKRGEHRRRSLDEKVEKFSERVGDLPKHEAKTIKRVLTKLGGIESLDDDQYAGLADAILTAWETGRLRELISEMAEADELDSKKFLDLLVEAGVVSALNVAESIKTKIVAIERLAEMVKNGDLENDIRDYLAKKPWILSPRWETFRKETRVNNIIQEAAKGAGLTEPTYKGRVDLAISSGETLVVVEFMKPNLILDWDHLGRIEQYVRRIDTGLKADTATEFKDFRGLIVADRLDDKPHLTDKLNDLKRGKRPIHARSWKTLLDNAKAEYEDYLDILIGRGEGDKRMAALETKGPERSASDK